MVNSPSFPENLNDSCGVPLEFCLRIVVACCDLASRRKSWCRCSGGHNVATLNLNPGLMPHCLQTTGGSHAKEGVFTAANSMIHIGGWILDIPVFSFTVGKSSNNWWMFHSNKQHWGDNTWSLGMQGIWLEGVTTKSSEGCKHGV